MSSKSSEIFTVRRVTTEETYSVRLKELRKGMTVADCRFDGDERSTTMHIGGFHKKAIVAVATLIKNNHTTHGLTPAYQLRGMAVLQEFWKKGYGQRLVDFGEKLVMGTNTDWLWMNARQNAFGFYEKLGYTKIGPIFEVPGIGKHQVLFKKINHKTPKNEP